MIKIWAPVKIIVGGSALAAAAVTGMFNHPAHASTIQSHQYAECFYGWTGSRNVVSLIPISTMPQQREAWCTVYSIGAKYLGDVVIVAPDGAYAIYKVQP